MSFGSLVACALCCTRTPRGQALIGLVGFARDSALVVDTERLTHIGSPEICPNICGGPGVYYLGDEGPKLGSPSCRIWRKAGGRGCLKAKHRLGNRGDTTTHRCTAKEATIFTDVHSDKL